MTAINAYKPWKVRICSFRSNQRYVFDALHDSFQALEQVDNGPHLLYFNLCVAKAKSEADYNAILVQKLECSISQREQKHLEEVQKDTNHYFLFELTFD